MKNDKILPGMTVLSADGLAVGRIQSLDADAAMLEGHGMLHGDHRIPFSKIAGVFDNEVYLRLRAAELAAEPGEQLPAPNF